MKQNKVKVASTTRNTFALICAATIGICLVYVSNVSPSTTTSYNYISPDYSFTTQVFSKSSAVRKIDSTNKRQHSDIMNMKPLEFLPSFKNPCWYENYNNGSTSSTKLQCLPYFYIIGVKKSGTSDLYMRIHSHPDTKRNRFKEAQWFARRRFKNVLRGENPRDVHYYIKMFQPAAQFLQSRSRNGSHVKTIIADASPSNLHNLGRWRELPGNGGLNEPRFTNFHYIKHLTPNVKIIILFRNPSDRCYSDYLHSAKVQGTTRAASPEKFHESVVQSIQLYTECFKQYSARRCIYNKTLQLPVFDFHAGFYAFFMKELQSVFTEDQILPIVFSEYVSNMTIVLAKVFRFLGLRPLSDKEMKVALARSPANKNTRTQRRVGKMLAKTRQLLDRFYEPYNREMAALMNDTRYLFSRKQVHTSSG